MAASTCEIILIVVLVVVLCVWYYMSVYRAARPAMSSCYASGGSQMVHQEPLEAVSSAPVGLDEGFATMDKMKPYGAAGFMEGSFDVPAAGGGSAVSVSEPLEPFSEAPTGVTAAMWPSGAPGDGDGSGNGNGMAEGVNNANNAGSVALACTTVANDRVTRSKVGGSSFLTTMHELLGVEEAQATQTGTAGVIGQSTNNPNSAEALAIAAEDAVRCKMQGSASMAYRTMNQHTELQV